MSNQTFTLSTASHAGLAASILESGKTLLSCMQCKKPSGDLMPKCQPRSCQTEKMSKEEIALLTPKPMLSSRRPNKQCNAHCHLVCPDCFHTGNHHLQAVNSTDGPVCGSCDAEIKAGTRHKDMGFQPVMSSAPIGAVRSMKAMIDQATAAREQIEIEEQAAERVAPGGATAIRAAEAEQRRVSNAEKRARQSAEEQAEAEAKRQREIEHDKELEKKRADEAARKEAADKKREAEIAAKEKAVAEAKAKADREAKEAAEAKKQATKEAAEAKKQAAKEAAKAKAAAEREAKKAADAEKKREEAEARLAAELEQRNAMPRAEAIPFEQAVAPMVNAVVNPPQTEEQVAQKQAKAKYNNKKKVNEKAKRATQNEMFHSLGVELKIIKQDASVGPSIVKQFMPAIKHIKKQRNAAIELLFKHSSIPITADFLKQHDLPIPAHLAGQLLGEQTGQDSHSDSASSDEDENDDDDDELQQMADNLAEAMEAQQAQ